MWEERTVGRILSQEGYAGIYRYDRRIKSGGKRALEDTIAIAVPALIGLGLWQAAQAQRAYNQAMSKRNGKLDFLLRGLIFCGCGRRMVGGRTNERDKTPRWRYKCNDSHLPGLEERDCGEPVYELNGRKVEK